MRKAFVLIVLAIITLSTSLVAQAPPPFQVIVNPKNTNGAVDRKFVEDAFLKKVTTWPAGDLVRPVDQSPSSATRRAFTREILGRSIEEVRRFWQQRIFSGRDVPPPEFSSDADVVKYVVEHDGAIGYVSAGASVGGARVMVVR